MRSQKRREFLQALLDAQDRDGDWVYILDVMKELGWRMWRTSSIYPLLTKLEKKRLLQARWFGATDPNHPRRRLYRVDPSKVEELRQAIRPKH